MSCHSSGWMLLCKSIGTLRCIRIVLHLCLQWLTLKLLTRQPLMKLIDVSIAIIMDILCTKLVLLVIKSWVLVLLLIVMIVIMTNRSAMQKMVSVLLLLLLQSVSPRELIALELVPLCFPQVDVAALTCSRHDRSAATSAQHLVTGTTLTKSLITPHVVDGKICL